MSSPEQPATTEQPYAAGQPPQPTPVDNLPPALSSMWRLCRLGYRYEPTLKGTAFVLTLVAAVPDALLAFWFKLLGEGLLEHKPGLLEFAVVALAVLPLRPG